MHGAYPCLTGSNPDYSATSRAAGCSDTAGSHIGHLVILRSAPGPPSSTLAALREVKPLPDPRPNAAGQAAAAAQRSGTGVMWWIGSPLAWITRYHGLLYLCSFLLPVVEWLIWWFVRVYLQLYCPHPWAHPIHRLPPVDGSDEATLSTLQDLEETITMQLEVLSPTALDHMLMANAACFLYTSSPGPGNHSGGGQPTVMCIMEGGERGGQRQKITSCTLSLRSTEENFL